MALFGALFAKKDKSGKASPSRQTSNSSAQSSPSARKSSSDKPVLPDIDLSMATEESDAEYLAVLHTPSRRKGRPPLGPGTTGGVPTAIRPSLAQLHDLRTTASMDLQPPPPRGSVFEKYAKSDRHGSTHSLPLPEVALNQRKPRKEEPFTHKRANSSNGDNTLTNKSSMADLKSSATPKHKMFGWMSFKSGSSNTAPSTPPSKPPAPDPVRPTIDQNKALPLSPPKSVDTLTPTPSADDSFKVTSFRHVRPVSPGPSVPYGKSPKSRATASPSPVLPPLDPPASASTTSLSTPPVDSTPLPIPRRRQESFGSDGSQKVTVAAFRQAQARRSSTNLILSDSPSQSPSSLVPPPSLADLPDRSRTPPGRPRRNQPPPPAINNTRISAFASPKNSPRTSEPGSTASWSSATPSDTDDTSTAGESADLARQSTVRPRPRSATVSHIVTERRSVSGPNLDAPPRRPARAFARPSGAESSPTTRNSRLELPPRSQSQASGSLAGYTQSWASRSTSALPARASVGLVAAIDTDTSDDDDDRDKDSSEDDSEEDAPLSRSVGPARPGTGMSHVSAAPSRLSVATDLAPRTRLPSAASSSRNIAAPNRTLPTRSSTSPLVDVDSKTPTTPPRRPTHVNSRSADSTPRTNEKIRSSQLLARHPLPSSRSSTALKDHPNPSPASSTGDSSSGKLPLTPRDGSEPGSSTGWATSRTSMSVTTELARPGHQAKKNSVSFEVPAKDLKESPSKPKLTEEELTRRERRRSEAKAAIELGNAVNGPPPIVEDDHDLYGQLNLVQQQQQMQMQMQNWEAWQAQARMSQAMFGAPPANPGFAMPSIPPPGTDPNFLSVDPNFLAAHQQAMLIAKQTYQMAVAQQALQAANDEWERSSNVTGFGGRQTSVYGGTGTGSVIGGYGMNMGMPMGGGMFPPPPASMYGGGGGSVIGAPPSAWGGSVYGEPSYGAPGGRWGRSVPFPQNSSAMSEVGIPSSGRPRTRTRTSPSNVPPPAVVSSRRGNGPSSWKAGQS